MPDPITTLAAAGTIFTSSKELIRSAKAVAEKIEDIERRGELLDLMEQLQRTQLQAMEQLGRAAELEEENKALRWQLAERGEMKPDGDVFYRHLDGGSKEGPFCARCWQADEKPVRLISGDEYVEYTCPVCDRTAGWTRSPPDPPELPPY